MSINLKKLENRLNRINKIVRAVRFEFERRSISIATRENKKGK